MDLVGLVLGTAGLFSVTFGLIEANERGWTDPLIVGSLVAAAVLLAAFLRWQHRTDHPMMPLHFFRIPAFSAGNAVAFAMSLGMFSTFFFMSLYMQVIRGYTPFQAGIRFLPMTVMIIATAPNAGRIAQRVGSRGPMAIGLTMTGAGLLALSFGSVATSYWVLAILFVVMGVGMGATMAPMTAAVMNAVGPQRAGLGSAMTNTSREVGGVFGIALLGTILTSILKGSLTTGLAGLGLASTQSEAIAAAAGHGRLDPVLLEGLSADQVAAVQGAFSTSFLDGFQVALIVAGSVLLIAAAVASRWIPAGLFRRPDGAAGPGAAPEPVVEPAGI